MDEGRFLLRCFPVDSLKCSVLGEQVVIRQTLVCPWGAGDRRPVLPPAVPAPLRRPSASVCLPPRANWSILQDNGGKVLLQTGAGCEKWFQLMIYAWGPRFLAGS